VISYICLGCTLLFEFILSTQFFVSYIISKLYANFPSHFVITRYHSKASHVLRPLCQDPAPLSTPPLISSLALLPVIPTRSIGGFAVERIENSCSYSFSVLRGSLLFVSKPRALNSFFLTARGASKPGARGVFHI